MARTSPISIGSLMRADDLPPDAKAWPEPHVAYDLRPIEGKPLGITVELVFRRGDQLVARASDGLDYPVTGAGAFVLCPRNR